MDHLLCRAFAELEEQSAQGGGGWKFKLRSPDISEFGEVVQRHGLYIKDLQDFMAVARDADTPSLFNDQNAEEPELEPAE